MNIRRRQPRGIRAGGESAADSRPEAEARLDASDPAPPAPVADQLDDLQGPITGIVILPDRLDWSRYPSHDLSDPDKLHDLYATVLRKAESRQDLATYLNRDPLVREWANLDLPGSIRAAWEAAHWELRPKTTGTEPQHHYMNGGWMDDDDDSMRIAWVYNEHPPQVSRSDFWFLERFAKHLWARAERHPDNARYQVIANDAKAALERYRQARRR
jgi:hypothetical protein